MSHAPTRRQVVFVAAALLLSPLLTLYATQAVWLQNLLTPFSWMASHLPASGLFWLLFFSLMLPLYGLTRRLFIAYLPGTGFCMTLAIISRYKMDINGAPLQLSDFTFVGNLGDIAGFASDMLAPTLTVVVSVIVCILWTVLLAVLGGAFAEGIDLAGERLENVIVVSTGLPQPDVRVRAMQRYHDESGADGYFLCMTLPGMVRVIQAAGRLIRTESDRGALLLIDSRYQRGAERALLSGTLIGDALSG